MMGMKITQISKMENNYKWTNNKVLLMNNIKITNNSIIIITIMVITNSKASIIKIIIIIKICSGIDINFILLCINIVLYSNGRVYFN